MPTSTKKNVFLWFGAAVSIAEILSGTLLSSLGIFKGISVIFLGHFLGGALLLGIGLIGADTRQNAMESVQLSFGKRGAELFSFLNVIQLIGWTAVMIVTGAQACRSFIPISFSFWAVIITFISIGWIFLSGKKSDYFINLCVLILFLYCLFTTFKFHFSKSFLPLTGSLSIVEGIELTIAMPLSWLPIISDYTSHTQKKVKATLMSVISYSITSCWMFLIGFIGSLVTHQRNVSLILKQVNPGIITLIVIILSTVTTAYLDIYSSGISAHFLFPNISVRQFAIISAGLGLGIALCFSTAIYEQFLYIISAVFIPLGVIQCMDYFVFGYQTTQMVDWINLLIWLIGFLFYELLLIFNCPLGYTLPCVLGVVCLTLIAHRYRRMESLNND